MKEKSALSARIKELRKSRGLRQAELATAIGLSMSAIRSYENGLREPNSKAMAALESYFNVSGTYLRGEPDKNYIDNGGERAMEKREFEELIGQSIPASGYEIIEMVYQWHPSIKETSGKEEVAELYKSFGLTIFLDMFPRAVKNCDLEDELRRAQAEVERIKGERKELFDKPTEYFLIRESVSTQDSDDGGTEKRFVPLGNPYHGIYKKLERDAKTDT